ncbi:NAD-dependent epimerase/dehydratase family protein [Streptococcus sp. sy018]|uniref:NAD-dependent epimerase/dehydratase family protein n=1 Tax=Streptococcus sp. sy018 TaxID=2600147 RepID=UPI0011B58298|nr:NAD-dependent epimerase/dehydratase family protein [Streptococcus sp. sy018]TWS94405.1 NAD-dependent epimerase/dehydratase family protein [Streptococcus sp. sy018]
MIGIVIIGYKNNTNKNFPLFAALGSSDEKDRSSERKMNILVTGGLGYLGSHLCLALKNHKLFVVDNEKSHSITAEHLQNLVPFTYYKRDIREPLDDIFQNHQIDVVFHMASLKSIGDSMEDQDNYYDNNYTGSVNLLNTMMTYHCDYMIFSSSISVYGETDIITKETDEPKPNNPYSQYKLDFEQVLQHSSINATIFRYTNPAGCHPLLNQKDQSLFSKLNQDDFLMIYGGDYATEDGTARRDYIHVDDLVEAHIKALNLRGFHLFNLGSGQSVSVLEIVKQIKKPYQITSRRAGDVAISQTNIENIKKTLNWHPKKSIKDILQSYENISKRD